MSRPQDQHFQSLLPDELKLLSHTQIASLWSSYGSITSLDVSRKDHERDRSTLILKSIHPPTTQGAADESNLRKLLSYEVERFFYAHLASRLPTDVKVARSYTLAAGQDTTGHLLMEDLRPSFPHPARGSLGLEATQTVLRWLAGFHATYWNVHLQDSVVDGKLLRLVPPPLQVPRNASPQDLEELGNGVWEQGTYWYLDTRGEEMASVDPDGDEGWLVAWADKVNDALVACRKSHATLVHGDAKGANIVFSHPPFRKPDPSLPPLACALYDFQYIGVNPPTHDLVYFLGTSVSPSLLKPEGEKTLLEFYFKELMDRLPNDSGYTRDLFDEQWKLSIVDWVRFMAGWGFWGNDRWATRRAKETVCGWEAGEWQTS